MVTCPVWPGYSGTIKDECNTSLVKGNIHKHLVERAIYKCRIYSDDWMQTAEGHASRRSNGMLFCNSDVENTFRIL